MHNAAFAALGLDWHYVLLSTPADQIEVVIGRIRSGELQGANVTIPYKQVVMPYLDEIDPVARAVGAVNTIVRHDRRLTGFNTDTLGFKRALLETGVEVKDQPCAVLGAGGSARAVVYVLREWGARITVYARDVEKAWTLLSETLPGTRRSDDDRGASFPAERIAQKDTLERGAPLSQLEHVDPATILIVNTTPVGLSPNVEASPWSDQASFPPQALVFDLLNNPPRTRFMRQAEQAGLRAVNGWNMLVYQGAAAFEKWTGMTPPVDVMKHALERSMKGE